MALTNAQRQKRWRDRRNAFARVGEGGISNVAEIDAARIAAEAEVARLKKEIARWERSFAAMRRNRDFFSGAYRTANKERATYRSILRGLRDGASRDARRKALARLKAIGRELRQR